MSWSLDKVICKFLQKTTHGVLIPTYGKWATANTESYVVLKDHCVPILPTSIFKLEKKGFNWSREGLPSILVLSLRLHCWFVTQSLANILIRMASINITRVFEKSLYGTCLLTYLHS